MTSDQPDPLAAAVLAYVAAAPWEDVRAEACFGLRDPATGFAAAVCVLGYDGIERGLGLYLGEEGFERARQVAEGEFDADQFAFHADILSLYLTPAGEFPPGRRRGPGVLPACGIDGRKFIPHAVRKEPGKAARAPDEREARFLALALGTVATLAGEGRLPPRGRKITVFVPEDGSIREELRPRPRAPRSWPAGGFRLELPAADQARLAALPRGGDLMVTLHTPPVSVRDEQARLLLILDPASGKVLDGTVFTGKDGLEGASRRLAALFLAAGRVRVPERLVTDSLELYAAVKDAFAAAGIAVERHERIPELDSVRESFLRFVRENPRGGR